MYRMSQPPAARRGQADVAVVVGLREFCVFLCGVARWRRRDAFVAAMAPDLPKRRHRGDGVADAGRRDGRDVVPRTGPAQRPRGVDRERRRRGPERLRRSRNATNPPARRATPVRPSMRGRRCCPPTFAEGQLAETASARYDGTASQRRHPIRSVSPLEQNSAPTSNAPTARNFQGQRPRKRSAFVGPAVGSSPRPGQTTSGSRRRGAGCGRQRSRPRPAAPSPPRRRPAASHRPPMISLMRCPHQSRCGGS